MHREVAGGLGGDAAAELGHDGGDAAGVIAGELDGFAVVVENSVADGGGDGAVGSGSVCQSGGLDLDVGGVL